MPEEKSLAQTIRDEDIYRQYAVTLISTNEFAYDPKGDKFNLPELQYHFAVLGGIANNSLLKRVGEEKKDEDTKITCDRQEIKNLIQRQKTFCTIKNNDEKNKKTDYLPIKNEAQDLIEEYDRLLIKHGVCK